MRLLDAETLQVVAVLDDDIPPYAILSHTWGSDEEEVSFQDIQALAKDLETYQSVKSKTGYAKIQDSAKLAASHKLSYIWIDTCCIDKTSSAELSEAINSMFRWYQEASECYAYLVDVHLDRDQGVPTEKSALLELLGPSRWFTRGWTLQELVAPRDILFFSNEWTLLGAKRGCLEFRVTLGEITSISDQVLAGYQQVSELGVATRMQWASNRQTTRAEDMAYCLLGLFGVNMPLLYGEGKRAFIRLQEEILRRTNDQSLLAWMIPRPDHNATQLCGLLAPSPVAFRNSGSFHPFPPDPSRASAPSSMTNAGLHIQLYLIPSEEDEPLLAVLDCTPNRDSETGRELFPCIRLIKLGGDQYARTMLWDLEWRDVTMHDSPSRSHAGYRYIYVRQVPTRFVPRVMINGLGDYSGAKSLTQISLVGVYPKRRWNPVLNTLQPDGRLVSSRLLLGLFRYRVEIFNRPARFLDVLVGFSAGGDELWDCWCFGRSWEDGSVPELYEHFRRAAPPSRIRRNFTAQGIIVSVDKMTQNNRVYISLQVKELPEIHGTAPGSSKIVEWRDISLCWRL